MRKLFSSLLFIWSAIPFAFWKMEGPFYDKNIDYSDYLKDKITIINDNNLSNDLFNHTHPEFVSYPHLYMYDENTNCNIVYANDEKSQLMEAASYMVCKGGLGVQYPYFYVVNKKLDKISTNPNLYKIDKLNEKITDVYSTISAEGMFVGGAFGVKDEYTSSGKNKVDLLELELKKSNDVILVNLNKAEHKTASGITIKRENGKIKISLNDKTKDFQPELKKYFEKKIAEDTKNSTSVTDPSSNNNSSVQNKSKITQKELDLLNNSNILGIFGFIKNNIGRESMIWGLAEDKNKKRFHYIMDLEDDISILMNVEDTTS